MIEKYIVAEVEHTKKHFMFHETFLRFDKTKISLVLEDEYVKHDIDNNMCYLYSVLENMVRAGIYSSFSSIKRAIKNNVIKADLNIIYITDISKAALPPNYSRSQSKTLEDLDKHCSGIQYVYSMNNESISRYELYGDPILGDNICRPISDLKSEKDKEG